MAKLDLNQPTVFILYGQPGSGKTFFSRQFSEDLKVAHLQADRIRYEMFDEPRYDSPENTVVMQLMMYMAEQFIKAGVSVVFDVNALLSSQRRMLAAFANKNGAKSMVIWFQVDPDSAYERSTSRDRRRVDDKFARAYDQLTFEQEVNIMQNPAQNENYIVLSGKHAYPTQKNMVIKRLYDQGLLHADQTISGMTKPQLVNLVPNPLAGRVDPSRRNISIR